MCIAYVVIVFVREYLYVYVYGYVLVLRPEMRGDKLEIGDPYLTVLDSSRSVHSNTLNTYSPLAHNLEKEKKSRSMVLPQPQLYSPFKVETPISKTKPRWGGLTNLESTETSKPLQLDRSVLFTARMANLQPSATKSLFPRASALYGVGKSMTDGSEAVSLKCMQECRSRSRSLGAKKTRFFFFFFFFCRW